MGAWIETSGAKDAARAQLVAPYVGAWIETTDSLHISHIVASHPTWVRGLKH